VAICQRTQRQVVALGAPGAVTSLPVLATRGAELVALQRHEIAQLSALKPPASDAAAVRVALRALVAATAESARLVSYARANDPQAVMAQQKVVTAAVAAANRALDPLGLNTCSG
jgi:microcystin-dependent protein